MRLRAAHEAAKYVTVNYGPFGPGPALPRSDGVRERPWAVESGGTARRYEGEGRDVTESQEDSGAVLSVLPVRMRRLRRFTFSAVSELP